MRIGVTLTSSLQVDPKYIALTKTFASRFAKEKFGLVYGGTDYGMMSELANSYKNSGGDDLVGVVAEDLMKVTKEYKSFSNLDEKIVVQSMEDRKKKIADLSDGFVILPGGYGTLEEIGSFVGGKANKIFDKPIVLFNFEGFYDKFVEFLDSMTNKKFSKINFSDIVYISDNIEETIDYLLKYNPVKIPDKFI